MMASAEKPCATRSRAGAAPAAGAAAALASEDASSAIIATQNATQTQISGTGSCSMYSSTPRNTNSGGEALRDARPFNLAERHRPEQRHDRHGEGKDQQQRGRNRPQRGLGRLSGENPGNCGVKCLEDKGINQGGDGGRQPDEACPERAA